MAAGKGDVNRERCPFPLSVPASLSSSAQASIHRLYDRVTCGDVSMIEVPHHSARNAAAHRAQGDAAALTRRMGRRRTSYAGVLAGALLIVAALPSASGDPGAPPATARLTLGGSPG